MVFKELRRLWEKRDPNLPWKKGDYDESNTLLVDDSPYKALLNPVSHHGRFNFILGLSLYSVQYSPHCFGCT